MFEKVCTTADIPLNGGATVKVGDEQIAIIAYDDGKTFYAVQNLCPHKQQMCLSRGIIGDEKGTPKVVCPLHKNAFKLRVNGLFFNFRMKFSNPWWYIRCNIIGVFLKLDLEYYS